MSARSWTLAAAAVAALAVAGCGGGGGSKSTASNPAPAPSTAPSGASSSGGGHKLNIKADPSNQLKFNTSSLSAKAGEVTIVMSNPSQLSHSVAIQGNGVNVAGQVVGPGGTSTASAKLKPGTYTFFCTVPGHRQAGMQGTLTVK
jgi:uncharacterized cupredoxin-like copper-binding protein